MSTSSRKVSRLAGSAQSVAGSYRGSVAGSSTLEHAFSRSLRSFGITSGNLAKVALTVLHVVKIETFKTHEGEFRNHLKGNLGEKVWQNLKKDPRLTLEKIYYCQVELGRWAESSEHLSHVFKEAAKQGIKGIGTGVLEKEEFEKIKEMKHLINHDFLILEIKPGDGAASIYIKAEKNGSGQDPDHDSEVGIAVSRLNKVPDQTFKDSVKPYIIDCRRKTMELKTIMEILQKEDPDYHVRDANCWNYARNTTKLLLRKCVELTNVWDPEERKRLEWEHNELENNLRSKHIRDLSKDLVKWISDQWDRRKWIFTSSK